MKRKYGQARRPMTDRQHRYLVVLLEKAGWGTKWQSTKWAELGFGNWEIGGAVAHLDQEQASRAIRGLELRLQPDAQKPKALRNKR